MILAGGERQASVVVRVGGRTSVTRGRNHWHSLIDTEAVGGRTELVAAYLEPVPTSSGERATLVLVTRENDWQIEERYSVDSHATRVERSLTISYNGHDEVLLRDVTMRIPPESLSAQRVNTTVEVPGYPTRTGHRVAELPLGKDWDRTIGDPFDVGWEPCIAGIVDRDTPVAVVAWCSNEIEPAMLRVFRTDDGVRLRHQIMLSDRLSSGRTVRWGSQYIEVHATPWPEPLQSYRNWLETCGIVAPQTPSWARDIRVYEVFVGEQYLSPGVVRTSRYQTIESITADLDRIRALGFTTIELMPAMPFPSYAVVDYYDVDLQYGSAEGLRELTARAHQLGLHVLLDIVIHGVMDQEIAQEGGGTHHEQWRRSPRTPTRHPLREDHPEWFVQTETGAGAATYTWAFDHANPEWREYMIEVFAYYAAEFALDGFRVDALTWNLFPNWARGLPYRASASIFGSRELSEQLRRRLTEVNPNIVLYTETTIAPFLRAYNFIYDYDMQWIYSALVRPISPRGYAYTFAHESEQIVAEELRQWLLERSLIVPSNCETIHHVDSHDSHEWGRLGQYRREAFGQAAVDAFFALCCFLKGGVMAFTGSEDGSEERYRRLLRLKGTLPALQAGDELFDAIIPDNPNVLSFIRASVDQTLLAVINFSAETQPVLLQATNGRLFDSSVRPIDLLSEDTRILVQDKDGVPAISAELAPFQSVLVSFSS